MVGCVDIVLSVGYKYKLNEIRIMQMVSYLYLQCSSGEGVA